MRLLDVGHSKMAFFDTLCQDDRAIQLAELLPSVLLATIVGPRLSRFGRTVQFVSLPASADSVAPTALLIAAPLANGNTEFPTVPSTARELGAVFGWLERDELTGALKLPCNGTRVEAATSASWHVAGRSPHGRLGSSLVMVRGASPTSRWVITGAPLASQQEEMAGEATAHALV